MVYKSVEHGIMKSICLMLSFGGPMARCCTESGTDTGNVSWI